MKISSKGKVLVTGATGYIAGHCIYYLLENNYQVRGTVRSINSSKNDYIYQINPKFNHNLELVEANLLDSKCWNNVVKGCDYVFHVASPFPKEEPSKESDLLDPALQGTRAVIQASIENNVKKVVYTSSIVAVSSGHTKNEFNEEDWTIPENSLAYDKSKYYAEKEAWKIYNENKGKLNLTVLNPGLVMGPTYGTSPFTSSEILTSLFNRNILAIP